MVILKDLLCGEWKGDGESEEENASKYLSSLLSFYLPYIFCKPTDVIDGEGMVCRERTRKV